jgi:hypothetical protein
MKRFCLPWLALLACGGSTSKADESYALPEAARGFDVAQASASPDGRFVLLGEAEDRGLLIIDRQTREVRFDEHASLVAPGSDLVQGLDATVSSVSSKAVFDFPPGTFDRPVTYRHAGDWLVRLGGNASTATLAAVDTAGRAWSITLPIDVGARVTAMDASGPSATVAVIADGPAPSEADTELFLINVLDGAVKRRASIPRLGEHPLAFSIEGARLLLTIDGVLSVLDVGTGSTVATGESPPLAVPIHMTSSGFWSFEYNKRIGESHMSPGTTESEWCELVEGSVDGKIIEVNDFDARELPKRLGVRPLPNHRCPIQAMVQAGAERLTIAVDLTKGRILMRPLR